MKRLLVSCLVISLMGQAAWSADWVWLARSQKGDMNVFADAESITHEPEGALMWIENQYKNAIYVDLKIPPISSSKRLVRYNCSRRSAKELRLIYFTTDGKVVAGLSGEEQAEDYVVPDSIESVSFHFACDIKARTDLIAKHHAFLTRATKDNSSEGLGAFLEKQLPTPPARASSN